MHAQSRRHAACCELVSDVASRAGEVRLRLTGTSMLPAMWPGDEVIVRHCGLSQLHSGDIVLYRTGGKLVAHRVTRRFPDHLITRGDSIPHCDPPVDSPAIIGYVVSIIRNQREIGTKQTWCQRAGAAVLCRSHLALRIALRLRTITARNQSAPALATSRMS